MRGRRRKLFPLARRRQPGILDEPSWATTAMKAFLKEYGLWIAVPFVLVALAIVATWMLVGDDGASPFVYPLR